MREEYRKKLLIYAHYYVPDVASTGQIYKELAEGLLDFFDITVICAVPSYYGLIDPAYKTKKYYYEVINGVKVIRVRVPEFVKGDKRSRIHNIFSYFWGAIGATAKTGQADYILALSQPPILGGMLGVWGKWTKHAKLVYNIQDFNPEQTIAVGYSNNRFVLRAMLALDKFSCRRSNLVITVGRDLVEQMHRRFQGRKIPRTVMINNWIDENETYPLPAYDPNVIKFKEKYNLNGKFIIMYSGNIGLYYDLSNIIKVIRNFKKGYSEDGSYEIGPRTADGREVVFAFVGGGSVKDELEQYAKANQMENVIFIPYQEKKDLIYSLNAGDVHWCVSGKGIKGVSVPSKVYGIMAVGKPALAVLEERTEAREIIEECQCGKCCNPGDYEGINSEIEWFIQNAGSKEMEAMGQRGRQYLLEKLTKEKSIEKYRKAFESI